MKDGIGVIRENEDFYEYIGGEINGDVKYKNSDGIVFEGKYIDGIKKDYQRNIGMIS